MNKNKWQLNNKNEINTERLQKKTTESTNERIPSLLVKCE